MEIKKAKDLMIPLDVYPHIPFWFTLCQAMAELEKVEFNVGGKKSLPRVVLVFNETYELLGMVRRRDILRGLEPESLANIMLPGLFEKKEQVPQAICEKLLERISGKLQRPVSDVMRPIKNSVDYDDNLIKVISKMADDNLSFVPVMKDNEVVGVVRTVEVIAELGRMCGRQKGDEKKK